MKRIITLLIAISLFLPIVPAFSSETGDNYGLKENPIVLSSEHKTVMYECEDYPKAHSSYMVYNDEDASNKKAMVLDARLANNSAAIPAADVPYRLYIKSQFPEKKQIRIWMRTKTGGTSGSLAFSIRDEVTAYRNLYDINQVLDEYSWYAFVATDINPDEIISLNIVFRAFASYVDKIIITTDMLYFPTGEGKQAQEFKIGLDTTDYNNLLYPLPPCVPTSSRPRVMMNNKRLKKVKENLQYEEHKKIYEDVVKSANKTLTDDDFSKTNIALNYVNANAFLYLVNKDEQNGRNAIEGILKHARLLDAGSDLAAMRESGYVMLVLAEVYDWCYDLLDDATKLELIEFMLYNASFQEIGYPPVKVHGRGNGHESEGDVFKSMLSCAIAIYDDYPEFYNVIAGKLFYEMISTRNYYHELGFHTQGGDYDQSRLAYEIFLAMLLDYSGMGAYIDPRMEDHIWDEFYTLRPDGYKIRTGDAYNMPSMEGLPISKQTTFFFGNYYKNPFIRDMFYRGFSNFSDSSMSVSQTDYLLYNEPSVGRKTFKDLPLTRYYGEGAGYMVSRTGWDEGIGDATDVMIVKMNANTIYGSGHDHLDSGHFDIYYKGSLALDSGIYNGLAFYDENGTQVTNVQSGSLHHVNYTRRTIAHNCILVDDPDEVFTGFFQDVINDGGQRIVESHGKTMDYLKENQKVGNILGVDYGEDMYNPSYSYLKGDLADSYSDKMEGYTRSFVFLNFFDEIYPGALIVFDKVTASNPEFKKTWLLHTQEEPRINGDMMIADKTEYGDNGRLVNQTILPGLNDSDITKIGGEGHEYEVKGKNYKAVQLPKREDFGKWRIEISTKKAAKTDYFLNVLHVTEADDSITPLKAEYIDSGKDFVGIKIKDRAVLLAKSDERYKKNIEFELKGDGTFEILVAGIKEGDWKIYKDGKLYDEKCANTNGGTIVFKGESGSYKLVKNILSNNKYEKNLNFKDYIKENNEDYYYYSFNNSYFEGNGIEENNKLYLPVEKIIPLINGKYELLGDSIIFKAFDDYSKNVSLDDASIKKVNDSYYVDIASLGEFYGVKWTKAFDNIYKISGGLTNAQIYNPGKPELATIVKVEGGGSGILTTTPPIHSVDGDISSRWQIDAKENPGTYALYTFDKVYTLDSLDILWCAVRSHNLEILTSEDGVNYTSIFDGWADANFKNGDYHKLDVTNTKAKYVKIIGKGNDSDKPQWFNYYEIRFNVETN